MMQKLNFRCWFEDNFNEPDAIQDPRDVAKLWHANMPREAPKQNAHAVEQFASYMFDIDKNSQAVKNYFDGIYVNEVRYDQPINNNLLNINDEKLKNAKGLVSSRENPAFKFFMGAELGGNLLIRHPPVFYSIKDEELIRSIIWHELRHAIDWINPEFKDVEPSSQIFDVEKYARNAYEARAFADQLKFLMKRIGNPNKVMKVLINTTYKFPEALIPVAKAFLKEYSLNAESFDPVFQPSAIVIDQQKEDIRSAAVLVSKIVQMMQFGNFIKKI